jgi:hypothetical protein
MATLGPSTSNSCVKILNLLTLAKSPLPRKVTYSQVLETGTWTSLLFSSFIEIQFTDHSIHPVKVHI